MAEKIPVGTQRLLKHEDRGCEYECESVALQLSEARRLRRCYRLIATLTCCLIVSVILNCTKLLPSWRSKDTWMETSTQQGRISYSGLEYNVPTTYSWHTDYWNATGHLSEAKWEDISIDPAVIAVTPEWAEEKGLPPSWEFPWDRSKRVYFIKVFHQLHCLVGLGLHRVQTGNELIVPQQKTFRVALEQYEAHGRSDVGYHHLAHCLDSLRQDLMCHADDTPMPVPRLFHSMGDGQVNQCMDFGKLSAWASHPERHSCHKHIAEYSTIHYGIERFAFCPPDSPYYDTMDAYFKKFGHHNITS